MIDLNNYKTIIGLRKTPRFIGETTSRKYFYCTCDQCGAERGFLPRARYEKSKLCKKCKLSSKEVTDKMKSSHWSKSGKYSPKKYTTEEQQKEKRVRELKYNCEYGKKYYQQHKADIAAKTRQRLNNNIECRISARLRSRLYMAIRHSWRSGSAVRDLGCTIGDFKQYLESKFLPGMTWENYGFKGWHIDHIVPLSNFNLKNREEFLVACHYTNLQPLWAHDNLQKHDKLDWRQPDVPLP